MSRMTKFLKQTTEYRPAVKDENNEPVLDLYGRPSYGDAKVLKCRRERALSDVLTTTGSVTRSSTIYYLDESVSVDIGDLLDNKQIIDFEEYVNENGKTEGYKVMV